MKLWRISMAVLLSLSAASCTTAPNNLAIATTQKLVQFERAKSNLAIKIFTLSSGNQLTYVEGGNLAGKPLLLIHGFGGNKDNFTRIADKLGDYHIIIPDLLGFGHSSKPPSADYRADAQAQRLHELLVDKGIADAVHVGGNSMGDSISVVYAALYPNTVKSLWLIDSAGFWTAGLHDKYKNATPDKNPLVIQNTKDYFKLYNLVMFDPPYVPRSVQVVFAQDSIRHQQLHSTILEQIVTDNVETRAEIIAE